MDKAERRIANTAAKAATVRMVVAAATVRTVTADEMAATSVKSATAVAVARAVSQVRTEDRSRLQYISAIRPIRENFRISGGGGGGSCHSHIILFCKFLQMCWGVVAKLSAQSRVL